MENLKYIVNELNKNFESDYNMISFDSLSVVDLLQVLVNVLHFVNATAKFEVSKNKDQSIMNILNALQTIKYVPEKDTDAADFREGLIIGKRNIIHPILYWILSNAEKVKKRVYFATYVEKVEIPYELLNEPEVEQINSNYDKLIEDFWTSYNENKNEKKNADESSELQEDTKKMSADMSYLLQRLDMQNDKLKNIPNRESLLLSVKAYRREVKQEKKLQEQLKEHKSILNQMNNEIKDQQATLTKKKTHRPENLDPIQQVSEEVQINKILADSQLPHEQEEIVMELEAFEKVAIENEPSQDELDKINNEMEHLNQSVQTLLTKKIALTNTNDDQLLPFRNQATIISNKKQELSNFIMKIKTKNDNLLEIINQKTMILREIVGGDILHGDELKMFISNLRERSIVYKKFRSYLQGIQAELGIATRTLEILKIGDASIENAIKMKKENDSKNDVEDVVVDDIGELKYKCKSLYQEANTKRTESAGIYDEMTQLRSKYHHFSDKYDQAKKDFDNATGNLSDELKKMEKHIEELDVDIKKLEDEWKVIHNDIENYQMCLMKYSENVDLETGISTFLQQLSDKLRVMERSKMDLDNKLTHFKQLKNAEQDEYEQLKRIKQMVIYKLQNV